MISFFKNENAQVATAAESLEEFLKFTATLILFLIVLGSFLMLMIAVERIILLMNARLIANNIAGIITVMSTTPDYGTFCYNVPALGSYGVVIGGGNVVVYEAEIKTAGLAPFPVNGVKPAKFTLGKGTTNLLLFKKMRLGAAEVLSIDAPKDFPLINCTEVLK